jgi:hypothetical protein
MSGGEQAGQNRRAEAMKMNLPTIATTAETSRGAFRIVARLPLAMFSVALLVHIRHLSGSFAVAGALPLRRLWATPGFMPTSPCSEIHTHCREQILYFDHKGLVRRHDYTSEVFGSWAKAAHYPSDHQSFEGVVVSCRCGGGCFFAAEETARSLPSPSSGWISKRSACIRGPGVNEEEVSR